MREASDIESRVRTLLDEALAKRLSETVQRQPYLCRYNHRQPMDARKQVEGDPNQGYNRLDRRHLPMLQSVGLCMMGSEDPMTWPGTICDEPIDAQRCPSFDPIQTRAHVVAEFESQVRDPEWLREHLPGVYELVWALDTSPPNYHVSFLKRLWLRVTRTRLEPPSAESAVLLLPERTNDP